MLHKKLFILTMAAAVTGCANLTPMDFGAEAPVSARKAADNMALDGAWNSAQQEPVIREGRSSMVLLTPFLIPREVSDTDISVELSPGATIRDVVAILGRLGHPIIIADEEAEKRTFFLPHYSGKLGGLLSAISRATDTWFTWHDGTILVASTEKIGITIPQEEGFADNLKKGLDALGLKEHAASWHAGMVSVSVSPSNYRKVKSFLERLTNNAAIVSLQVAIVNVTLNQTAKQGIDWDALQISAVKGGTLADLKKLGESGAFPSEGATLTAGTSTTGGESTDGATSAPVALVNTLKSIAIGGSGLKGAVFHERFNFTGLFNYLQNYGDAETKQNVILKTVAGNKVEFKSLMQIPYVAEVGVTTTGTPDSSSSLGSTKTEKADDGITVEMTPLYDDAAGTVTIDLNLSIKAVVAFNELSAGNQIGKLTQPTTADRSFTDTLRLRPGQTVVVGGLTYDSISNNRGAPLFLHGTNLESQSLQVNRQTMFIVVRPTVTKLGQLEERQIDSEVLDLMPTAQDGTSPRAGGLE